MSFDFDYLAFYNYIITSLRTSLVLVNPKKDRWNLSQCPSWWVRPCPEECVNEEKAWSSRSYTPRA